MSTDVFDGIGTHFLLFEANHQRKYCKYSLWTSTTQSNSKICQTILNKTDKSTRKMEQGLRATFPKRSNLNYNI